MSITIDADQVDLTRIDHLTRLIEEIENESNLRRKRDAFLTYECREGRQEEHVIDSLKNLYPDSYQKFRVADISVVRKIIRKKAKAYKTSPIRVIEGKEAETKKINKIYDDFKFSRAFKEADKIFNESKYVCMWLTYTNPKEDDDALEGSYTLQALAPYEYDLVRNSLGAVKIFALSFAGTEVTKGDDGIDQTITEDQRDVGAQCKVYKFWSATDRVEVTTRGEKNGKPNITNIDAKNNPLNRLPIAFLSQDTDSDYPIPNSLGKKSVKWNVEFSDLKTSAATQGHGQLVISHPETIKLRQLHMGMHTAIQLPQSKKADDKETTAEYISASPDLSGQLEVLKFSLVQLLDDEGITAKQSIEGGADQVASGFDRLLKEADVQDIIEDNQELYADCLEQDVYEILFAFESALNTSNFTSDHLSVRFEKPKVLISDKETLDNIQKREELGLLLPHEKHMVIDPNLNETSAKKREDEIQKSLEEKQKRMAKLFGTEEDDEEETPPIPKE